MYFQWSFSMTTELAGACDSPVAVELVMWLRYTLA